MDRDGSHGSTAAGAPARRRPHPRGDPRRRRRSEFADRGFAGARVDEIAARTRTTKRMIYYYFGSKEQLFVAVLERAYAAIRAAEQTIDVDHLDPAAAIRRLAELTFDHHESHPDFIRLVSIENIHRAEHMAESRATSPTSNSPAIELIDRILERGRADGVLHARRRRRRPAHDDQRVLRLPRRQPPHVRRDLRPRPDRPRAARRATARCSATWSSSYLCDAPA